MVFCWFVGLGAADPFWDVTVFTKNTQAPCRAPPPCACPTSALSASQALLLLMLEIEHELGTATMEAALVGAGRLSRGKTMPGGSHHDRPLRRTDRGPEMLRGLVREPRSPRLP